MSIRLLQSIFIAGVLSPVDGSTLSLSAALEADLVNQGKAAWVVAPELTASELAHAGAHARMRQPNGVPIILAQSAIPMILPSSGTMGANGALTGLTALPYTAFPQPCFMYFPAGKVFSGSPAGMYYASITAATTATVYNNRYSSGRPQNAIPGTPTPVVDAGPGAYTQSTSEIALLSLTVPGGIMGESGSLLHKALWSFNGTGATVKYIRNNLAGTQIKNCTAAANVVSLISGLVMSNRVNEASQIGTPKFAINEESSASNVTLLSAIDTAVDCLLSIAVLSQTATDWVILERCDIGILPG